jgi:hypothetical protein
MPGVITAKKKNRAGMKMHSSGNSNGGVRLLDMRLGKAYKITVEWSYN